VRDPAIQTFTPGFCFAGSRNQKYRQIGNAVPVRFAEAVAEHPLAHMVGQRNEDLERRVA
jgi:site-specific DNA-cytosine methylase